MGWFNNTVYQAFSYTTSSWDHLFKEPYGPALKMADELDAMSDPFLIAAADRDPKHNHDLMFNSTANFTAPATAPRYEEFKPEGRIGTLVGNTQVLSDMIYEWLGIVGNDQLNYPLFNIQVGTPADLGCIPFARASYKFVLPNSGNFNPRGVYLDSEADYNLWYTNHPNYDPYSYGQPPLTVRIENSVFGGGPDYITFGCEVPAGLGPAVNIWPNEYRVSYWGYDSSDAGTGWVSDYGLFNNNYTIDIAIGNFNDPNDWNAVWVTWSMKKPSDPGVTFYKAIKFENLPGATGTDAKETAFNSFGDYYPVVTIRRDFKWWNDTSEFTAAEIKKKKTFYNKYRAESINNKSDTIAASPDEDKMDDIFTFHGVNIYSPFIPDNKYNFYLFKRMLGDTGLVNPQDSLNGAKQMYFTLSIDTLEYTLRFQKILYEEGPGYIPDYGNQADNDKWAKKHLIWKHEWVDRPNVSNYDEFTDDNGYITYVEKPGEPKELSMSDYIIWMIDGHTGEFIQKITITGLQILHRVIIGSPAGLAENAWKIVDEIPSEADDDKFRAYLGILPNSRKFTDPVKKLNYLNSRKSVYQTTVDSTTASFTRKHTAQVMIDCIDLAIADANYPNVDKPKIFYTPLAKDILYYPHEVRIFLSDAREIHSRSRATVVYGSTTTYVTWKDELKDIGLFFLEAALTIYSIYITITSLGAATSFTEYVKDVVLTKIKSMILHAALEEIFGNEIADIVTMGYNSYQAGQFDGLGSGSGLTGFATDLIKVTPAVINAYAIYEAYELQDLINADSKEAAIVDDYSDEFLDEEEELANEYKPPKIEAIVLGESPKEFINRTTNSGMLNGSLIPSNLAKVKPSLKVISGDGDIGGSLSDYNFED